ncbi:MAG: hypothetical protein RMJ98_01610 [Myxococcales bacterium]|nr:DUF4139 domain-containing protein [Polyangiaceae bacterium]MDW8247983.1 hypothetical protein [Myxococcales bacterium]
MAHPNPRVRRLVLFRHGACYVERGGPVDGPFELTFRRHEMNEVLKSLAIWVASGNARVQSVSFEASQDPRKALADRCLLASEGGALSGWLEALRGRLVRVQTASGSQEGHLLGVENTRIPPRLLLVPRTGVVTIFSLADLEGIEALDEPSRQDLDYLLDRERAFAAGERRVLRVALAGKADDLRVACVVPATSWKLSYRLLRQSDTTLLVGWALVHNPTEEDLDEIELILSSAQPVSFLAELHGLEGPPQALEDDSSSNPSKPVNPGELSPTGTIFLERAELATRIEPFEYRMPHRVSLRRGGSAMVPVVASSVAARVERVWRDEREPSPEITLTFSNSTLAVLEEGPAVIYDRGSYVGEALLPFTRRGEEVQLSYAHDTSVRCTRTVRTATSVLGVRLSADALLEEQQREETHAYMVESSHLEEVEVLLVRPRNEHRAVSAGVGAVLEESQGEVRLRVRVPPQGRGEASLVERWREVRRVEYERLTPAELSAWLEGRFIDRSTHDALASVLAAWAQAASFEEQRGRLEREQQDAIARHAKLRDQIAVLGEGGQEGAIRLRFVKDMEREQDRIFACENELRKVRDGEAQARKRAAQTLSVLAAHAERLRL